MIIGATLVLGGALVSLHQQSPPFIQVLGIAVAWLGALYTLRKEA